MKTGKSVPGEALKEQPKRDRKWKEPVFGSMPSVDGKLPLAWRFSHCDRGGPYTWMNIDGKQMLEIMTKIPEFEQKTWDELKAARCHPIGTGQLEKAARDRLVELSHDDQDSLMVFHLSGRKRIWCIKDGNLMRVLWWDPEHEVYKTEPDRADRQKRKQRSR